MKELNGDLYNASTHRLSWALLRITMILTTLRCMDTGKVPEKIECADTDFDTASPSSRQSRTTTTASSTSSIEGVTEEVKVSETYSSAARATLLSILPDHFTSKVMKAAALKISKSVRTVERQIRRAINNGQVKELGKGSYQKIG